MTHAIDPTMLDNSITSLMSVSFYSFLVLFVIKFILKKSTFEYLKILSGMIILTFTLLLTKEAYIVEQKYKLIDKEIVIKTSTLSEFDKKTYLEQFKNDRETLEKIDINYIITIAKILILGLILIAIRDNYSDLITKVKEKVRPIFLEKGK